MSTLSKTHPATIIEGYIKEFEVIVSSDVAATRAARCLISSIWTKTLKEN